MQSDGTDRTRMACEIRRRLTVLSATLATRFAVKLRFMPNPILNEDALQLTSSQRAIELLRPWVLFTIYPCDGIGRVVGSGGASRVRDRPSGFYSVARRDTQVARIVEAWARHNPPAERAADTKKRARPAGDPSSAPWQVPEGGRSGRSVRHVAVLPGAFRRASAHFRDALVRISHRH